MRAVDIIMKKRNGGELIEEEINFLIEGYVNGSIPEYQISAWCMAVYFKGMTPKETGFLTKAMINSGEVFNLDEINGPLVDKHSTGGVGDKLSLILAPLAASCGLKVPMMSGRALGHTGGTLDKLDSIPGYSTSLNQERFVELLKTTGFAMTGQSKNVVPADKKMYALRDVTATVESIPLITASIMSKKFAEGAQSLIFDVKCGKGAFMKTTEDARALAISLVETGKSLGRNVVAVITKMDEPLGNMTGNFLEVEESIYALENRAPKDVMDITLTLTAWMLVAGGIKKDFDSAYKMCIDNIKNGKALELFYQNVKDQGGDVHKLRDMIGMARGNVKGVVKSKKAGYIVEIDAFETGMTAVNLGVGRNKTTDDVEPFAGIEFHYKVGDKVEAGDTLCTIYCEKDELLSPAIDNMENSIKIGDEKIETGDYIIEVISSIT